jgi:cyclopropane fatty-acyl-phospholipid synthase-like methyltransferase
MEHLDYLRKFWKTEDIFQAMFERILVVHESAQFATLEEKIEIWKNQTKNDVKRLTEGIPVKRAWQVLEIGCGIGRLIRPLSEFFSRVDGVDISESMVKFSADYLENLKNVNVCLNNGKDLSGFASNTYDFIYSMLVFQHIRSYKVVKSYLQEVLRTLKPGGYFRFQVFIKTAQSTPLGNYDTEADNEPHGFHGNAYSTDQLKEILNDSGFRGIKLIEDQYWIWATARKQ